MKRLFTTIAAICTGWLLALSPAHAHVKWFVEEDAIEPLKTYTLTDGPVLIWLGVIVILLGVALFLDKRLSVPSSIITFGKAHKEHILWVVHWFVGGWLIANFFSNIVFVPPFEATGTVGQVLRWGQLVVGALVVTRQWGWLSGLLLGALYVGASMQFGWIAMMEHFFILAFAYLFFRENKDRRKQWEHTWEHSFVRITAGVSLIWLGLSEKLLHPELAIDFLSTHAWNFMSVGLGLEWFTDSLFVLSAGMTEVLFGIIYILGVITRINTVAFGVVLVSTAIVLGPSEIIGHLPIFAAALLFLVYGSGQKLHLPSMVRSNKRNG